MLRILKFQDRNLTSTPVPIPTPISHSVPRITRAFVSPLLPKWWWGNRGGSTRPSGVGVVIGCGLRFVGVVGLGHHALLLAVLFGELTPQFGHGLREINLKWHNGRRLRTSRKNDAWMTDISIGWPLWSILKHYSPWYGGRRQEHCSFSRRPLCTPPSSQTRWRHSWESRLRG